MIHPATARHAEWLGNVITAYGSLEDFPDARTVRIMRAFLVDALSDYRRIGAQCADTPEAHDEWVAAFGSYADLADCQINELDQWLKNRGLEP